MCGILGWLGAPLAPEARDRMACAIRHRGPDDHGLYQDASAGLGLVHKRLAIIDLSSAGHQPMTNEDGRVVLVYNGEIYNFQELREELVARGHVFRSRTDSEVVVHGYEEWGEDVVSRAAGMFAFALWDARDRSLFLARDPLGIKPLYYTWDGEGRFVFASELKAFLSLPGFAPRANRRSLSQFLELNFVYDVEATSLEGVFKLPPGHTFRIAPGRNSTRPRPRRYYAPPSPTRWDGTQSALDARADGLHDVLSRVVDEHLIADVPVGLLLSGGVDSSIVTALARRRGPVRTISMAFTDAKFDELPHARRVAEFTGTTHEEVFIRPEEVVADLERSVWWVDDLFGDWGVVSTALLYRKCREAGAKVVLVGEGSDELFGGYPDFASAGGAEADALSANHRGLRLFRWLSGQRFGRELLPFLRLFRELDDEAAGDAFSAVRLFETRHQLPHHYVMKVDKASMSASVEARVPFLDVRVAREAFSTPRELLLRNGTDKFLLRYMAERHRLLPKETTWRPKFGGSIAAGWMEDSPAFRAFAESVVLDAGGWAGPLGVRREMEDYFRHGRTGRRFPAFHSVFPILAWRLLLLNLWSRLYLRSAAA